MMNPGLRFDGYCYLLAKGVLWERSRGDDWEVVVESSSRAVEELGARVIDGSACMVFRCDDGAIRALTMVAAMSKKKGESRS